MTTTKISSDRIAARVPRSLEEFRSTLTQIEDDLVRLEALTTSLHRSLSATIDMNAGEIRTFSPGATPAEVLKFSAPQLAELRQNYSVLTALSEHQAALTTMIGQLHSQFDSSDKQSDMIAQAEKLRETVERQMNDAATTLAKMSEGKAPEPFLDFVNKANALVRNSIAFENSRQFSYVFETGGGEVMFSHYYYLSNLVDENGKNFSELVIITSGVVTGANAAGAPRINYFLNVMPTARTPSAADMGVQIKSPDGRPDLRDYSKRLHTLLTMDQFTNTVGVAPMNIKPFDPKALKAADMIEAIETDDRGMYMAFILRPAVQTTDDANRIRNMIASEARSLIENTNGDLKTAMAKVGNRFVVKVALAVKISPLVVEEDDIKPFADTFNLTPRGRRDLIKFLQRQNAAVNASVPPSPTRTRIQSWNLTLNPIHELTRLLPGLVLDDPRGNVLHMNAYAGNAATLIGQMKETLSKNGFAIKPSSGGFCASAGKLDYEFWCSPNGSRVYVECPRPQEMAATETAAPRAHQAYTWRTYKGPTYPLTAASGKIYNLEDGDRIGLRKSGRGKGPHVRLILQKLGNTILFTLSESVQHFLAPRVFMEKNPVMASASQTASVNDDPTELSLDFIETAESALGLPGSEWFHPKPLPDNGTTRCIAPRGMEPQNAVDKMLPALTREFGVPVPVSLGSAQDIKTWTWRKKFPDYKTTVTMKLELDLRDNDRARRCPVTIRTMYTAG